MKIFNRYFSTADLLLLLGDVALAIFVIGALRALSDLANINHAQSWTLWTTQGNQIAFFMVLSFYYSDLYVINPTMPRRELMLRLVNGFGVACLIVGAAGYLIPGLGFENIQLVEMLTVGIGLFCWRVGLARVLESPGVQDRVLIVGTQKISRMVAEEIFRQKHLGIQIVGFIGPQGRKITLSHGNPVRVSLQVFPQWSTFDVVEREGVNRILVETEESCNGFPAQELVTLRLKGMPIEDCHTFYEKLMSKIPIWDLHPSWIALSKGFNRSRWILFIKRVIDISASAIGLVLASPIALLTSIAIKLDSPGPILYHQERVGRNESSFILYKFRSMVKDAEAPSGPVWAAADDPRTTRVGKIIRKLRVDEIPQMINVLKGDMSFVGPRPERSFFVSRLKEKIPYYHLRFSVKPGITGWAQIMYDYGDSEEDAVGKLEYDLYYLKYMSPVFDLQILVETFKVVIFGRGAH